MSPTSGLTETLLRPLLRTDPHRPRLTWYGGDPAGRTELSTASLANWAAKTAGLLVDELGVDPGGVMRVRGVGSWQLVPAALGGWWAGLSVDLSAAGSGAGFTDALVTAPDVRADEAAALADEVDPDAFLALTAHPLALPAGGLPSGARDYSTVVRAHADRFPGVPVEASATALVADAPLSGAPGAPLTVIEAVERARELAAGWGPQPRVLAELGRTVGDASGLLGLALAVLAADGSLVVVDPATGYAADTVVRDEQVSVPDPF